MKRLFALLIAVHAPLSAAQIKSDWERANEERLSTEDKIVLPPFPRRGELIEFAVDGAGEFRFFIDRNSVSVGRDGIVRYALVARSSSGVENISYEGLRCKPRAARSYAFGHGDGSWTERHTPWREGPLQRWQFVLHKEYFCPAGAGAIRTAGEGVAALEQQGHPSRR